jgi:hypothetical protein
MIVTLSENRVLSLIQQLEGIQDPPEEIIERMERYAARIFRHVYEGHRLRFIGLLSNRNKIGEFKFSLETDDMNLIVGGLNFMTPVCISVEPEDMPHLVPDPVIGSTMRSAWSEYAAKLQKISPSELAPIITDLYWQTIGGRLGGSTQPATKQGYDAWLKENGLKDPGAKYDAEQAYREKEEAAYKAAEDARTQRFYE